MSTSTSHDTTGLDGLDLDAEGLHDATHFRNIIAARQSVDAANDALRSAVEAARAAGDSWVTIGAALEVSKQAAQQRFGKRA